MQAFLNEYDSVIAYFSNPIYENLFSKTHYPIGESEEESRRRVLNELKPNRKIFMDYKEKVTLIL